MTYDNAINTSGYTLKMTELQAVYLLAAVVVVLVAVAVVVVTAIRTPSRVKKFLTPPNCLDRLCDMKGSFPLG